RLLSWSYDTTIRLWDADGTPLNILSGHTAQVIGVLLLEDGRLLSWGADNMLHLWNSIVES
ncbi:MAG: hypothetical protein KJ043_21880, partial [Anaerolineae bacterium]|nr:hypothetical protein [Anaerolineae bacterium]